STLSLSCGMPRRSRQYSTWLANASLSSHRSMSSMASPCCFSSLGTANTGPMPISSGSQPATASARNVPSGVSPRCSASFAPMITQAEAPSQSWLALRISVLRLAGDAVARRHDISGLDHRHPQRGFVLLEPVLIDRLAVRVLHQADAFIHQEGGRQEHK